VGLTFLKHVNRNEFEIVPILLVRPWEKDNVFIDSLNALKYPFYEIPVAKKPPIEGIDYLRVFRCVTLLSNVIKGNDFKILHMHGYFANIISVFASFQTHIPKIVTFHGRISNDRRLMLYNMLNLVMMRFSHRIIAVSEDIGSYLV